MLDYIYFVVEALFVLNMIDVDQENPISLERVSTLPGPTRQFQVSRGSSSSLVLWSLAACQYEMSPVLTIYYLLFTTYYLVQTYYNG